MPKINFLRVTNNQEKLFVLTKIIQKHFDLNHKVLILCETQEVATYIDQLIWRLPEDSFLPHAIANEASNEAVVITCQKENLNNASILLNLCNEINPAFEAYQTVYELYDETHPVKAESSKQRNAAYQGQGFPTNILHDI